MQKVMQKLRAKTATSEDVALLAPPGDARELSCGFAVDPTETALSGFIPVPPTCADLQESPEVVGDVGTTTTPSPSTENCPIDTSTIEWDAGNLDPSLVTFHEKYSSTSEQYRSLRARLLNMNAQRKHQVIGITSSLPQEGKSVTTLNLGMVMAEDNDQKILLIDADFRRASLARMFGISPKPGLAELIRGTATLADVVRPTHYPNLKIITSGGTTDKNYGALLGASAVRPVLQRARELFDYSFVDTPPVNTVSDVGMLAPHCDGVIIVIEMRRTPEHSVLEAVRTLQTTNVKILGCLLSRYDDQRGHYYERYYSYYYNNE